MVLALRKSDWVDDWYVLEEDGREVGSAQVEGNSQEWAEIAEAMKRGENKSFRRCAATRTSDGGYEFHSPRNSYPNSAEPFLLADEVNDFANAILNEHGPMNE